MINFAFQALHDPNVVAKLPAERLKEYERVKAILLEHAAKATMARDALRQHDHVVATAERMLGALYYGK